jgi:putative membrane protein insertion efficiency factor
VSAPLSLSPRLPTTDAPTTDARSEAARPARRRPGPAAVLIRIIGFYQVLRAGRPSPCRFWPTCSAYAVDAIDEHGAGRGSLLALRRVLRCHPWGGHGADPVPERVP